MSEGATAAATGVGLTAVVDEGLGNSCYLLDLGDRHRRWWSIRRGTCGRCARPRRRPGCGSGSPPTPTCTPTSSPAPCSWPTTTARSSWPRRAGGRQFEHRGLGDGDEVDLGGLTLTALATPGHTDEHLSFLLRDGDRPVGVFTGGSLIVGSAARTDLLGAARSEELARAQFASLRRVARAARGDGGVADTRRGFVLFGAAGCRSGPPRSAGSWPPTRWWNRATRTDSSSELLGSLGSYPPYFLRLAEINRRGPDGARPGADRPARFAAGAERCASCVATARSWWTRGRCPTTPARTSRGRCRSRCAPSSRPGWAGWFRPTRPSWWCATPTRTSPSWSGRR